MKNPNQKTFLVTGGASGIGAALARLIAEKGNRVVIADINLQGAETMAASIGPSATAVRLDICSEQQWESVLDRVWADFGGLDVLINNAAIVHTGFVRDVAMDKHQHTMDTNFFGPVKGMLAVLPRFNAQGHGHLATVCSMTGLFPFPGIVSYAAAKHALRAFHLGLAVEERHGPLKFTIVHPTSTETPMLDKEAEDDAMALSFAGTPVTPEFVANVVLESIENNVIEAFAPPERGEVVKDLGINPDKLWALMDRNAAIGAEKLAARRAAKAAATS
ncbi:MAG TPA: SDR family oxidoreductase [Ensifer sp.]|nr:SDR family oxidoreductase [Ensifer sp.]